MNRDIDVLVVGDANPDLILLGDVVPRFGQSEQLLESADLVIGGSGAIVAHGLARLGLRTALVAVIGADAFGALTRERLAGAGIDTTELRTDPALPTGLSVILAQGENRTTLTLIGAIGSLDPAGIGSDLLGRTRHVHASSFFLQPTLAAGLAGLFRRAHRAGATTSLDTNLDPADRWDGLDDVLPETDVLLPNRTEILGLAARYRGLAGTPVGGTAVGGTASGEPDVVAAAQAIAELGPLVVVKDGERGAIAVPSARSDQVGSVPRSDQAGSVLREPGYPVVAIDSTGAGDSFDAAFLAARHWGLSLPQGLALACEAGALSTLAVGGTSGQVTAAQLRLGDVVSRR